MCQKPAFPPCVTNAIAIATLWKNPHLVSTSSAPSKSSRDALSTCRVHSQCSINAGWHDIYVEFIQPYLFLHCLYNLYLSECFGLS